jgi:hypothetical protein
VENYEPSELSQQAEGHIVVDAAMFIVDSGDDEEEA